MRTAAATGTREFERTVELDVKPEETIYGQTTHVFERSDGLPHPDGVDLLVNGLGCRHTGAEWSFDYLCAHSTDTTISETRSRTARVADGDVLVAAKPYSGRKTDLADVLAAVPPIDLRFVFIPSGYGAVTIALVEGRLD
jgi:hypothetical protein